MSDLELGILFGLGCLLGLCWLVKDYQGKKHSHIERVEALDQFDPDRGIIPHVYQARKLEAQIIALGRLCDAILIANKVETVKLEAYFTQIRVTLAQIEAIEQSKLRIALMRNIRAALEDKSKIGERLAHIEELRRLILSGKFGESMANVEEARERETIRLDALRDEMNLDFDMNSKVKDWEDERDDRLRNRR
jgi:hypothetical protein